MSALHLNRWKATVGLNLKKRNAMMTTEQMKLTTGNRLTADDGMVAWLIIRLSGLAFTHQFKSLERRDAPTLSVDNEVITTSLGITGFVGELAPTIWPENSRARAHARSLSAEAFGSLHDFKCYLPMALNEQFMPATRLLKRTAKDFAYLTNRWQQFLELDHQEGPFLFGSFSAADAFQAPLVARCVTYGLEVNSVCETYIDAIMSYPAMAEWQALAGQGDESPQTYEGLLLTELHQQANPAEHQPLVASEPDMAEVLHEPSPEVSEVLTSTDDMEELVLEPASHSIKEFASADDETLPFRVDVVDQSTESDIEPSMVRPQTGNRLFPRAGKRLFQPPYRPIDTEGGRLDGNGPAEPILERPARSAGIKPIGGEIRRRR